MYVIFTYMFMIYMVDVGKYSSAMEQMGIIRYIDYHLVILHSHGKSTTGVYSWEYPSVNGPWLPWPYQVTRGYFRYSKTGFTKDHEFTSTIRLYMGCKEFNSELIPINEKQSDLF